MDTGHIETITLSQMLPRVFAGEPIPPSEVWNSGLTFTRGERYLVKARSGGGKSSMCAYIYGLRTDFSGQLLFDGTGSDSLKVADWQRMRRLNIAYLPQELSLFPELTAMQNILLKASLSGNPDMERITEWMKRLGIDSRAGFPVGRMSIGQQQRVAIIRSLCQPFDFILLDEPVSHLDDTNNRLAAEIISEEAARQDAAIIATSVGNHISIPGLKHITL